MACGPTIRGVMESPGTLHRVANRRRAASCRPGQAVRPLSAASASSDTAGKGAHQRRASVESIEVGITKVLTL